MSSELPHAVRYVRCPRCCQQVRANKDGATRKHTRDGGKPCAGNGGARRGIHTCHDQCPRPLCVAGRRIRELEALLSAMSKREGEERC